MESTMTVGFSIPKPMQIAQAAHEKAGMAIDCASAIMQTVDRITGNVAEAAKRVFSAMGFFAAAGVVFAVPSLISNITKAVYTSDAVERVKSIGRALLDGSAIWGSVHGLLSGLKSVGVIAAKALSWTGIVNAVLFPLQFISLGLEAFELGEVRVEKKHILSKLSLDDVQKSLQYVQENHATLRKQLVISKTQDLAARALNLKNDKEGAEEFIKLLRRRIHTKYNLKAASVIIKITTVGAGFASLIAPVAPATLAIAGVSGLAGLVHFGIEKLLLNKNPFSEAESWHQKLAQKVRNTFAKVTDAIANAA